MIITQTAVKILDNSGGKLAHCIKFLNGRKVGSIGHIGVVSLRKITKIHKKQQKKVTVGKVYRILIIQTVKERRRFDGTILKFSNNGGVLLTNQNQPIGTRIKAGLPIELKEHLSLKTISIGSFLI